MKLWSGMQAVQLFGINANDNLVPVIIGDDSDVDAGTFKTTLFGPQTGAAPQALIQANFVDFSNFAGNTLAQLGNGEMVGSFQLGPDAAGNAHARIILLPSDGLNETTLYGALSVAVGYGFNGTAASGLDRLRTASATNLDPTTNIPAGVAIHTGPGHWSQSNEAAVNTQATTTKAAVAGKRHVCTGISGSLVAVAAVAAPLYLRLRDGATGAGTILWSCAVIAPAGTSVPINITGLNIPGTVNTAMTVEFSAAPGATEFESVSMSGYTV